MRRTPCCLIFLVVWIAAITIASSPLAAQTKDELLRDYAMEGELEEVERLLAEGANPNTADEDGESALMYGASSAVPEIVGALLEAGADPDRKNSDGLTALMSCVISDGELDDDDFTAYLDIARLLIESGATLDETDDYGKTALAYARDYRREEMAELLEDAGS